MRELCESGFMRSTVELIEHFRAQGLKVTPQRELVFRLLENNTGHPTADSVYAAAAATMPTISLKTVYQVLNDLRELGEIQTIEVGTGAIRFDPNTGEHHHLVCRSCGLVRDIDVDASELSVPRARRLGYTIEAVEVTFRGVCADCRRLPAR
jgi:Fe2+ or Zn2+ uptake regulation protein